MHRGLLDTLMAQLGRVPRHCRSCGKRFYALPAARRPAEGQPPPDAS